MIISHFVTQQDADLKVNPLSSVPTTLIILSGPRWWEGLCPPNQTHTDTAVPWRFMRRGTVRVVNGNVFLDGGEGLILITSTLQSLISRNHTIIKR